MTVEQSPLPVRSAQRTREENPSLIYAKVREVTGAPDSVIEEAIKACIRRDGTYKVEDVVTTIITDDSVAGTNKSKTQQSQAASGKHSVTPGDPAATGTTSTSTSMGSEGGLTSLGIKRLATTSGNPVAQPKQDPNGQDFVDLTRDNQVILGGQVSREEQDISRVLEQSLAESKGGTKRKRGELWFIDPLNPHERKRQDGWPVGLKNVGNTCWFSAVIQSLFHIQEFQNLVLAFKGEEGEEESSLRRNIRFVWELKQLFALLTSSTRKYVDPSKAVNILKEDSSGAGADGQQDVSEFQHKLLDWLEDAFSVSVSSNASLSSSSSSSSSSTPASSSPSSSMSLQSGNKSKENPMKRLFLGKYKAEGVNEGKVFHQEVTFGQYPLNVLGFRNIHESLEATMAQGEIETVSGNSGQKSGQEIWFTHLPVVLTFELSRFGFNPQLNQAEKIHQQLFFPQVIFMDRYLECNKSCIRQKREEARKLREQLTCLQRKLDKFMNYGSSSKRYPLPDVLQYALDFAQSSPVVTPSTPSQQQQQQHHHPNDVDMETSPPMLSSSRLDSSSSIPCQDVSMSSVNESPSSRPSATQTPATTTSTPSATALTVQMTTASTQTAATGMPTVTSALPSTPRRGSHGEEENCKRPSPPSSSFGANLSHSSTFEPCPREVTESELRVLQDCLRRWRTEVETDVRELQRNISGLEGKLSSLYSEASMRKYPYHLHAVLVHEGQAVSGHYWSFIYDDVRESWLKFNDITVSQSSWEEMQKESIGGFHNASAYCLMYVDRSRLNGEHVFPGSPEASHRSTATAATQSRTVSESLPRLPEKLRLMVEVDNAAFLQEMEAWDNKQRGGTTTSQGHDLPSSSGISSMPVNNSSSASCSSSPLSSSFSSSARSPPPSSSHSTTSASPVAAAAASTLTHNARTSASTASASMRGQGAKVRTPSGNDPDVTVTGEQRPGEASIIRPLNQELARLSDFHAKLSLQATLSAVRDVIDIHKHNLSLISPADVLEKAMSKEFQRLKEQASIYRMRRLSDDIRLTHPVLYLIASGADARTVDVVLSEQFSLCALVDSIYEGVWRKAQEQYSRLYHSVGDKGIRYYEFWHRRYYYYRQAVARFVGGLEAYCAGRYQEALPYLTQAWLHNCQPGLDAATMATVGINPGMLAYFRRSSLQRLNETTMKMFETESDMTDALTIMTQQILPALSYILSSNIKEDVKTAEEIREKWCQFLEKDLDGEKIERLQDFLSKIFEISGVVPEDPEPVRWQELNRDLHARYIHAIKKVKDKGELELCMEGS